MQRESDTFDVMELGLKPLSEQVVRLSVALMGEAVVRAIVEESTRGVPTAAHEKERGAETNRFSALGGDAQPELAEEGLALDEANFPPLPQGGENEGGSPKTPPPPLPWPRKERRRWADVESDSE